LVEVPNGRKPIGNKWEFKKKLDAIGQVEKYRGRLVEKWYSQFEGVDFSHIFSTISKLTSNRVSISLVVKFYIEIEKKVVKEM
jgi:hypothetical protein